jgi:hypothetical protein
MGTSKGYELPTDPQWAQLKGDVTRTSRHGSIPESEARRLLGRYIGTNGGAREMARGGGALGGTQAAQRAGRNLAGFASAVANRGLDQALREFGLGHLIGRSAKEIAFSLVDELCGDGSTLDEVDARNAMSDLNKEMLEDADTYEDVVARLGERMRAQSLGNLLLRFFGYYLYHQFLRSFYERLVRKHGGNTTDGFLGSIRRFIASKLRYETYERNLVTIDWRGSEGQRIINNVLQRTLEVFES